MTSTAARKGAAEAKSKKKEKRQQRHEEALQLQRAQQAVKDLLHKANAERDLFQQLPSFSTFERNGLKLELRSFWAEDLPPRERQWLFALCKANMEELYNTSWGWKDGVKKAELAAEDARYVIAYEQGAAGDDAAEGPAPVAFVHYRWEAEEGLPVLYCYELQLEPRVHRKGLGRRGLRTVALLFLLLELAARRAGVHSLLLTVHTANAAALALYGRLGYAPDETSPEPEEGVGYVILSKWLLKTPRPPPGGGASAAPARRPLSNAYQLESLIFS